MASKARACVAAAAAFVVAALVATRAEAARQFVGGWELVDSVNTTAGPPGLCDFGMVYDAGK
jgi:hypothetical protein